MNQAFPEQKFQDWFTQQWAILWGRKIDNSQYLWLNGPIGELNGIGESCIYQLAKKEELTVARDSSSKGLINSVSELNLSDEEINFLPKSIIDFYEKTSDYELQLKVNWNPIFKFFGILINNLFSQRIQQLNIPIGNYQESRRITSEIIQLISKTNEVKYTIWLRKSSGTIIYSGIYTTFKFPSGLTGIKAIFPLPKGSATVLLKPKVNNKNEFILESSGAKFGDAGFYFIIVDSIGNYWSQYLKSFTDQLIVFEKENILGAIQTLRLWNLKVVSFEYNITHK